MKVGIDLGGTKTEGILIDSNGKELLLEMIKIWQNKGRSILITAHNNNQLKPLLTSIYEINNTKLIKI